MHLAGSVALITGGASGLGLATATALSEAGAAVVLVDLPTSNLPRQPAGSGGRAGGR